MPRPKSEPSYCIHKRSGRAYTTVDGRQIQLGPADTEESKAAFDRVRAAWLLNGRRLPDDFDAKALTTTLPRPTVASTGNGGPASGPAVAFLLDAFWTHAQSYYTTVRTGPDGEPVRVESPDLDNYRQVIRMLRRLYGHVQTTAFGCPELEALRQHMISPRPDPVTGEQRPGWCRTNTNRQIGRVRQIFKWGVTKGIVPENVPMRLAALAGLRRGKTEARESGRVRVVEKSKALAIVPHVAPQVAAMVKLQLWTGMRSTEVCIMRPCDIDQSAKPWVYRPAFHKTEGHDISREIPLGPKARKLIKPFLKKRDPHAYLFRPAEAMAYRRKKQAENRETPVQPSQVLRAQLAKRRKKTRKVAERYDHKTYRRAVEYGCMLAFEMPHELRYRRKDKPEERRRRSKLRTAWLRANAWHPHQARHTAATDLRRHADLETARIVLGHTSKAMTERYAEPDLGKSREVMEAVG